MPSRRTLKNSRLVSKKDDVHVCIMCLRAIMNYQVCWSFWFFKKKKTWINQIQKSLLGAMYTTWVMGKIKAQTSSSCSLSVLPEATCTPKAVEIFFKKKKNQTTNKNRLRFCSRWFLCIISIWSKCQDLTRFYLKKKAWFILMLKI